MQATSRLLPFVLLLILISVILTNCSNKNSEDNWNQTVNRVSSGVVSIQTDFPVSFDGKWNHSGYATGFIVDAKRGIILSNRHVISPGPITAKAVLVNNEEIDLTPLYFDPVHDFGFFKYDPSQIQHIEPHEFKLSDEPPKIGESIRIIGNDAGQKISILDGTISRLDRDAPNYGKGKYNDFNIFYIQAATSTTGGSSGSPVINVEGEAVALNAGSETKSANAFYVPLDRIKFALRNLQNDQAIARGTLKTTFKSTSYVELKRLGMTPELESQYRAQYPEMKGLLVVDHLLPASPAAEHLSVGDILLQIDKQTLATFTELEKILNSKVDDEITVKILRQGQELSFPLRVDDLHALSPTSIVKFDGGVFHTLSYQQARHFNKPIAGVYVASSGGAFGSAGVPAKSVITEFNGQQVNSVEAFNTQLLTIENGKKINLRYFDFSTPNTTNYALVEIKRKWFEHSYCQKSTELSHWPCTTYPSSGPDANLDQDDNPVQTVIDSGNLQDSLVNVSFSSPYSIQGRSGNKSHYGTGVIVDIHKGWVVVPRNLVFSMLGDVKITFNNRYQVDGKVEYIHPLHNLALISYVPEQQANIRVSQVKLSARPMQHGETVVQVGLNYDGNVEYRETQVDKTEEFWLREFNVPQFVDKNIEATHFVNPNTAIDGIIVNSDYEVSGFWIVFDAAADNGKDKSNSIAGLSSQYVMDLMATVENNTPVYSLDIDLTMIAPVDAIQMGLDEAWLDKLSQHNPDSNKLLAIYNVSASSSSAQHLKRSDILLAINDVPVSNFRQVEELTQAPSVNVTYFSEGQVYKAEITTTVLHGKDIERVFYWSGLYLHAPHRAAQLQGNVGANGVYVASYRYGSPASRYGLYAMRRIIEIDGQKIETTDDFVAAVKGKPHQASVLIKTLDFNNKTEVITLKVDNNYWPFYELRYENGDWQKIDHMQASND